MMVAVTGGTGFVGGHLAAALSARGHHVVLLARGVDRRPWVSAVLELPGVELVRAGVGDEPALTRAFDGCLAVAHCAGINRELGRQTYQAVHVQGTANVVRAAERAGVRRLALISFLRARPGSGRVRPLAADDVVDVLCAALVDGRLPRMTVPLVGPTELGLQDAVALVARVTGRQRPMLRLPTGRFLSLLAWLAERVMTTPVLSVAQARILSEQVVEPTLAPDRLPADLVPSTPFDERSVRQGLPDPGRFGLADLRCRRQPQHGLR